MTHVATGLLFSQLIPSPSRVGSAVAGIILSLLPDLDYLLINLDRLAFIRFHRGFTHSLVALPLFALAGAGVGQLLGGPRWFRPLFWLGLAVLVTHLLLDLATSYGTQLLSPFSRRRYTLDWVFIIDPYLTFFFAAGAAAAMISPLWGKKVGAFCLAGAWIYLLLCGCYHHQALGLARQVFPETSGERSPGSLPGPRSSWLQWQALPGEEAGRTVAALPQPFSCRRWLLIAAAPGSIKQAFVQLPYLPFLGREARITAQESEVSLRHSCRAPEASYRPPRDLLVQTYIGANPVGEYPPEARRILDFYLEFARFPLLRARWRGEEHLLEWLDLRFTVPGRAFPFVLQLRLSGRGQLQQWVIGPCQE